MKPALLLIPGMLNDASVWQHVLPLLPTTWTVRIADVLTQDSIADMAADAWKLMADLDKDQPLIVAGFSMGGYVAIDMLAHDTGRIHAAALLSTSVLPETQESRVIREKTIAAMQANFPKVIEGILKFSTHEASQAVVDELRTMQLKIGSENAVRQIQALMGRSDHRAKLSTLRLPVALMCGEHDRVTPPDLTRHIQACMPHASTTWVPTGHMLPVQTPAAVSQCLISLGIYLVFLILEKHMRRNFNSKLLSLILCLLPTWAMAQTFPDRPIKVVVPFAPGNTLDNALRQVAEEFKKNTGQAIVVENKPGGSGIIAAQAVMQAPADGYTLLLSNTSMLTINPYTFSKLPYDPEKSYKPVTGFLGASLVLAVNAANVPANNVKDFVTWAKAQSGGVSFASFTAGNSSHFAGVIMNQRTGLNMVHVPFNGTPPAVQNLVGGQVHAAFLPLLAVRPHVESGKVKVLAVSSPQRSPLMPNVGTFTEQGLPDLEIYIWSGLSAPANTPDAVINKLHAEFTKVLKSQVIIDKWRENDFEPLPFTPAEFQNFTRKDAKRWQEAVKISGFKAAE